MGPRLHLADDHRELILGDGEDHADGLQLRDHQQPVGVGRVNDIARIHQPQADSSRDRRCDLAVVRFSLALSMAPWSV